jgi:hypothetical protein
VGFRGVALLDLGGFGAILFHMIMTGGKAVCFLGDEGRLSTGIEILLVYIIAHSALLSHDQHISIEIFLNESPQHYSSTTVFWMPVNVMDLEWSLEGAV